MISVYTSRYRLFSIRKMSLISGNKTRLDNNNKTLEQSEASPEAAISMNVSDFIFLSFGI